MAPALVETITVPVGFTKSGIGEYKEVVAAGPKAYQPEQELKGTAKQPPAKYPHYLPTWDAETK
jgi:sulfonate dioxygenase